MARHKEHSDAILFFSLKVVVSRTVSMRPATQLDPEEWDDERRIHSAYLDGNKLDPKALDALEELLQELVDKAPERDFEPYSEDPYDPNK